MNKTQNIKKTTRNQNKERMKNQVKTIHLKKKQGIEKKKTTTSYTMMREAEKNSLLIQIRDK